MTRKIRTPAELDALPQGVVLTSKGVSVAVKLADGLWGAAGFAGAIDSETVARCAHGYLSIVGNISAPVPAPSAATARHERAVAYADDVAEGGAPVPDDYERHYCTDDGEDWPCDAARAARVPEAPVEESADWTYPTATDMTLGDFQSAGLIVPGILVEFYDQRGSGTALIGHLNDLLGICDDCPENRNAQVVRYRRVWSPDAPLKEN